MKRFTLCVAILALSTVHIDLYGFTSMPFANALYEKTKRLRRHDANGEERSRKSGVKPRPPPESYLSTKWTHSALPGACLVICVLNIHKRHMI